MYWSYFKYIVEHKKNVFIECLKTGQVTHSILHDLSKFLPSEFIPYAKFFKGKEYIRTLRVTKESFDKAWLLHQHRNKHHWDYWVNSKGKAIPMPKKYIKQMVADWDGMSCKFGGSTIDYYKENRENFILHSDTIKIIERILY